MRLVRFTDRGEGRSSTTANSCFSFSRDTPSALPHSLMTARESSNNLGSRRRVVEGAGPQRPAGPVGADDDARGRSLRADEREFAWRGSIRKETFACA
jgi:hypothetical protein